MVSRFDSNRLAEIFKRPTTFGDYCDHVADCSNGEDEAAARAPVDASERGRYEGVYARVIFATQKQITAHFIQIRVPGT